MPDWKKGLPTGPIRIGKLSHLRFLGDNKKIEVDCIIASRIRKVLHPLNIPVEFHDLELQFESETSAKLKPETGESISKLAESIVSVQLALLAAETKLFGCKALDANIEASQLQKWICASSAY